MASMKLNIAKQPAVLVAPSRPTPKDCLYLSNIDDQAALRFHINVVQFYRFDPRKKGEDPARVIREGLAKVLVFYYPLAGRLRDAPDGKLLVDCTGEGVLFVEADADVALEEITDHERSGFARCDYLLQDVPGSQTVTNSPLILIQITRLRCGGFTFAVRWNHTISDALGLCQFMKALGEMAKEEARPSVLPVWERELLRPRKNPKVKFSHYDFNEFDQIDDKNDQMVPMHEMGIRSFFFGVKEIESLKRQAVVAGQGMKYCPTFEVLSACLWRSRTRALQLPAEQEVWLIFAVDALTRFNPPLPQGFYGNALVKAWVVTTAGELANKPLSFAVKLIHEAKAAVNEEFVRSEIDFLELRRCRPRSIVGTFVPWTFTVSDVSKIGFGDVDFGWGRTVCTREAVLGAFTSFFIQYRNRSGLEGILVPISLPPAAMQRFAAEISQTIGNASLLLRPSL